MAQIWLISDTHFGHENIIRYCSRPFGNAEEMNWKMVANWNETVKHQDHVYHLGDFAFGQANVHQFGKILNGHKRLILGNHDNHCPIPEYYKYFKKILCWRKFGDLILTHVPIHQGSFGKAKVNVHGHIHNNTTHTGPYINVSVEEIDYRPIAIEVVEKWAVKKLAS